MPSIASSRPRPPRIKQTVANGAVVLGTATTLTATYFALKALFVYLVASGLGLAGCWALTLIVAFLALQVLARIVLMIAGGVASR